MERPSTIINAGGMGFVVVSANLLVAAVLITGMIVDRHGVTAAVIAGAGYFTFRPA